jgi:ABC-2 type transport system ATP-binding protein
MRELIRELRRMGKTILVSSHILPELEELCTWIGFIDEGRMVAAGPMSEVRNQVISGRRLRIELVDDAADALLAAEKAIRGRPGVVGVEFTDSGLQILVEDSFADQDLLSDLVRRQIAVRSFTQVTGDLAEAFLRLTGPEGEA